MSDSPDSDGDGIVTLEELKSFLSRNEDRPEYANEQLKRDDLVFTKEARDYIVESARDAINDTSDWVTENVLQPVLDTFIKPIYRALFIISVTVVGFTGAIFLGPDKTLGNVSIEDIPGLAEIPLWVTSILIDNSEPFADAILKAVLKTNQELVGAALGTGPLAPVALTVLQMIELGLVIYLALMLVETAKSTIVGSIFLAPLRVIRR